MERELILHMKDCNYDKAKLDMEIETMEKLLPYIESFQTFEVSNDIFGIRDHKLITGSDKTRNVFKEGLDCTTKYYVFCKN